MNEPSSISITVGGDFCPRWRPQAALLSGELQAENIVGGARALVAGSDIGLVNLECPLTRRGAPIAKAGANIRVDPENIRLLTHLGVDVVSLATNHIRDFGDAGVQDTLDLCAANGIRTVGAGASLAAARQALYVPVRGRTVAFLNAAQQEFGNATPQRAGACPLEVIELLRAIKEARAQAEHVVVILHGGLEYTHCPSPESVKLLRFVAEQGVAAVVRHHGHWVQGYEVWQGVPIFYGLGNLLFDADGRTHPPGFFRGLLVTLALRPDHACAVRLHPLSQCQSRPVLELLEGEARESALAELAAHSRLLADERALRRTWEAEAQERKAGYYGSLFVPSRFLARVLRRLGLLKYVRPSRKFSLLAANLLRCDAHRELLIEAFSREYGD